jgi:hypothetical protein
MIVILSPDDLVYDFKGNKKKPKLTDFPVIMTSALDSDAFGPDDVVIYRYEGEYGEETVILKGPCEEVGEPFKEVLEDLEKNHIVKD